MVVEVRDRQQYRHNLEAWLADPYFLDDKWTKRARLEVKEDPNTVRSNVEALRQKVQEEKDLYARTDDLFLLAFLRARKHNVDEALKVLKSYYQTRSSYPEFFELCLPSEQQELYDTNWINVLEDKDQLDRPVIYFRADYDINKITSKQMVQMLSHTLDLLIMDPHVQICGISVVSNMSGQALSHLKLCNPTFVLIISRIFHDTFPVRVRCSVFFNVAYFFKKIWALFRPLLKEKIRNRNHLLGEDLTLLHELVTPDVLPSDAKGKQSYCQEILQERVGAIESYLKDWSKYGYNKQPPEK